ncbi:MAG TPA: ComEA family DNA-binding protein [Gaiellaceae bacterium]|nr:ComEA family DNA-binding protein [Gaiellaceae bacterium]
MGFRLPALSRRQLFGGVVAAAVLLVLVVRHLGGGGAPAAASTTFTPLRVSSRQAAAKLLVVDVAGDVRRPGLYSLRSGSRVDDAIVAAGGATRKAQLDAVNLAAPIADGEQIVVPGSGAGGVAAVSSPAGSSPSAPLDLNSATLEQLEALPGIGPVTAQKILDFRQQHGTFHSVAELEGVPGIGPAHVAQLKGLVIP